jgi:hypothetical protein
MLNSESKKLKSKRSKGYSQKDDGRKFPGRQLCNKADQPTT